MNLTLNPHPLKNQKPNDAAPKIVPSLLPYPFDWSTTDLSGRSASTRTSIGEPIGKRLEKSIVSRSDSAFEVFFEMIHFRSSPENT